nr:hypothetical protein CFP56_37149 [Quercus suber]
MRLKRIPLQRLHNPVSIVFHASTLLRGCPSIVPSEATGFQRVRMIFEDKQKVLSTGDQELRTLRNNKDSFWDN